MKNLTQRQSLRLLSYAGHEWRSVTAILGLTALAAVIGVIQPWPMKILVDYGLRHDQIPQWLASLMAALGRGDSPRSLIWLAGIASVALFALNTSINTSLNWLWSIAGRRMTTAVSTDLFSRLQRRSLLIHYRSSVGDSLNRVSTDAWSVMELTNTLLVSPPTNLLTLVLVGTVSWQLNGKLALIVLVLAPLLVLSSWLFGKRMKRRAVQSRGAQVRLATFVHQTLAAIPVVKAFGREDFNRQRFDTMAEEATGLYQRGTIVGSWYEMVNGLITTAGMAIVLYAGAWRVLAGDLSVGGLLVFTSYIGTLQTVSQGLLGTYVNLKPIEAKLDRVIEVLDSPVAVPELKGASALSKDPETLGRSVSLENVTFGYETDRPVIRDVSIEAAPGQTIALVGETGAGKSTVAGLIPRFYDPWSGRVMIDGIDLRHLQLASVRQQVAMVLQEPFILPISIADNIAYGNPAASRDLIIAAARVANAAGFIEQLPEGYDSIVGERGATLSGGEKQRLSIARALLKDAPVLILDEPTSSLDAATEASLIEALRRLTAGRTTFIIGHRLSTLIHADEIVVFENGAIVERGKHEALIREPGIYRRYFVAQFGEQSLGVAT